ncbi:hypothetical protein SAMN05421666_2166 [Roseovarius nanhaiticus]|uniref:Uncharacterized protein n=3 Tax=Roseovarius nanhaiticus TaxID=573024 RepID=A0A1N7GX60_9RHOB|nr:hypothetical protein [Roseovarius nanhaiticus]SIS17018.1 hypothetical protein SAMN05421666_2166 [Roseovarius nanhaiticus]
MHSLNFATKEELARAGLAPPDIDIFNELRTRHGELTSAMFETPPDGMSERGALILLEMFSGGDAVDARMTRLALTLSPAPPIPSRETATLTLSYNSDIDREFRTLAFDITLRGPSDLNVYDISHDHIIEAEVQTEDGNTLMSRTAMRDPANLDSDGLMASWTLSPGLRPGERWDQDGAEIYARLQIETRERRVAEPVDAGPPTRIHRSGRYQVLGQPQFRFDGYTLAIGFPGDALFDDLGSIFTAPNQSSFALLNPVDPKLDAIRQRLSFEPASLDFEGMFELGPLMREGVTAPGWVWMLSGPDIMIGYEPDADFYAPRPDLVITLPARGAVSDGGGTPFNVTEKSLLDRPELFAGDPGVNCRPFDQPGRILGERRFSTALRVTQPYVAESKQTTIFPTDVTERPVDYPRSAADDAREIDYDSDPRALYQAKTVTYGHIIETAVRYRSNGYSLGDIAYSLTLAPRQKRQIVKMDYMRRESAMRIEDTVSDDQVADETERTRSYDNAVEASLDEWARGRSRASTTSAAAGMGFAMPGFVAGGGVASSTSSSSSSQEGGRRTAASETQDLRDSIRRWGESVRSMQSTVITENEQSESIQGVSEVIQNINYTRSLSVIYYEILRHLRIDTEIAGVSECLYVPLPVRDFTDTRIRRYRDVLRRYARGYWEKLAFRHLDHLPDDLDNSDLPEGRRADQPLSSLSGSLWVRIGLGMPGEGEVADAIAAATDKTLTEETIGSIYQKAFSVFAPYLGRPVSTLITKKFAASPAERNRYFQSEIAPNMARRYIDELVLLDADDKPLSADFTMASSYRFGSVLRVDFTVDLGEEDLSRADLEKLTVRLNDKFIPESEGATPERTLPKNSFFTVTRASLRYANDLYEASASSDKGERDLVSGDGGEADPSGALLTFRLSWADRRNIRDLVAEAYKSFTARLAARPFFYHKAIWWNMDRDELFTLLDGYAISRDDPRSLASVIQHRPLGIVGNSLVFRTTSDTPLDPMFDSFDTLKNHYVAGLRPTDPMRISLPTDGLYARAHLDGCVAAEEHNGSFEWVFDNVEPELAGLPDSIFDQRRAEPANLTPSAFPTPIINLQNAPQAPGVSGLDGVLGAVQNAGAFRDMAGLAGTQENVRAGLAASTGLATAFGGMALQGALAQMESDAKAGTNLKAMMDALKQGVEKGVLTADGAAGAGQAMADRLAAGQDEAQKQHERDTEKAALGGKGGGEVTTTGKDGTRSVKKNPEPAEEPGKAPAKPSKPVGHVKWLPRGDGRQDLLLYNFKVGDLTPALHPDHIAALRAISVQIKGVEDIEAIEGRASATKSKTDDPEEKNEDLSIARMELVWIELMRYALAPQSNIDKQKYLSDDDPIRARYTAELSGIDDGVGDEDPVERSVFVKLARKVDPKPKPKPVPEIPDGFDIPEITCVGHTLNIGDDITIVVQNNTFIQNNTKIVGGDDLSGLTVQSADGNTGNIVIGSPGAEVEMTATLPTDTPGKTPEVSVDAAPTRLWHIDISQPRVSGASPDELLDQLEALLRAAANVADTTPSAEMSIGIPGVGEVKLSEINGPKTILTFFSEVATAVIGQGSMVRKTLRGLMTGTVEVDVRIHARPASAPDRTDKWIGRTFTLSGPGTYYAREVENPTATIEGVRKFKYETASAHRLSDWEFLPALSTAQLKFKNGSLPQDILDLASFLSELLSLVRRSDMPSGLDVVESEIEAFISKIDFVSRFIGHTEDFVFKPSGEIEERANDITVGRSVTMFDLPSGSFRAKT